MFARVAARQPATTLGALIADVGEHGAIVESPDALAEALDDHPDTIRNATTCILGMEEQPRTALGFLLPSVLGSPATVGSAKALKAVASTTNASQLVRLAELLRHCESLVPSQPRVIETVLECALEHGHPTYDKLSNTAIQHMTRSGDSCSALQFLRSTRAGATVCHRNWRTSVHRHRSTPYAEASPQRHATSTPPSPHRTNPQLKADAARVPSSWPR